MADQISVNKYADSIIRWGGFLRAIITGLAWIYIVGAPLAGFAFVAGQQQSPAYILYGVLIGAIGGVTLFGYRLIFDYFLMKAHQAKQ